MEKSTPVYETALKRDLIYCSNSPFFHYMEFIRSTHSGSIAKNTHWVFYLRSAPSQEGKIPL
jgi:hypothetical protein